MNITNETWTGQNNNTPIILYFFQVQIKVVNLWEKNGMLTYSNGALKGLQLKISLLANTGTFTKKID